MNWIGLERTCRCDSVSQIRNYGLVQIRNYGLVQIGKIQKYSVVCGSVWIVSLDNGNTGIEFLNVTPILGTLRRGWV